MDRKKKLNGKGWTLVEGDQRPRRWRSSPTKAGSAPASERWRAIDKERERGRGGSGRWVAGRGRCGQGEREGGDVRRSTRHSTAGMPQARPADVRISDGRVPSLDRRTSSVVGESPSAIHPARKSHPTTHAESTTTRHSFGFFTLNAAHFYILRYLRGHIR